MKILNIGATGGIGQQLSKELTKRGHDVYGAGRREDVLASLTQSGDLMAYMVADISTEDGRKTLVDYIEENGIGCVVYAQGLIDSEPLHGTEGSKIKSIIDVNLTSVMLMDRDVLQRNIGLERVVYLASISSLFAWPAGTAYQASKSGLLAHIASMRLQDKKYGRGIERIAAYPETIGTAEGMSSELTGFPKIPSSTFVEEFSNIIEAKYDGTDFVFMIDSDNSIRLVDASTKEETGRITHFDGREIKRLGSAIN